MLCGVGWEIPPSGVQHAWWRKKKESKTFFLDFQNDESPNPTNGLSPVLAVQSQ
jgi:hypothetical protein